MKKIINWWCRDKGHKYLNGGKGVISILLVVVMLPFVYFADFMVESARYHSAVTLLDEAMDSSCLSTLSNYDKYLFERFGILALDNNVNISESYSGYLRSNTESLKAWNFNEITANGKYALTNNDILIKQVAEFSQYGAPTALVNDLGLGELISALEKMTKLTSMFDIITGVGKTTDAMLTLADSVEALKDTAKTFETDRTTYTEKYNAFNSAHSQLTSAIATREKKVAEVKNLEEQINASTEVSDITSSIKGIEEDLEGLKQKNADEEITDKEYEEQKKKREVELEELNKKLEEAQKENQELYSKLEKAKEELNVVNNNVSVAKTAFSTAQGEYSSAIGAVITDITNYQTNADKVMADINGCVSSVQDLRTTVGTVIAKDEKQQEDLKKQEKELKEKIKNETDEKKKQEYMEAQKSISNQITDLKASGNSVEAAGTAVKDEVSSYSNDIKDTMSGYNRETLSAYITKLGEVQTKVNTSNADQVTANSSIAKEQYYVELSTGFLSEAAIQTLINTIEEKMSGGSFWDIINAMSTGMRSLFSTNLIFDSRMTAYISAETGYEESEIDLILGDLSKLMNLMDTSGSGITGWIKILTRINEIVDALESLGNHLTTYLTGMMTRAVTVVQDIFSEKCGEKMLLDEYMIKTLSNRTDMSSEGKIEGKSILTGYSFENVKFHKDGTNDVPILGDLVAIVELFSDVKTGGDDIMFSGAELEYILTGSRSEVLNQTAVFFQIYFVRLFIDLASVLSDEEVEGIAELAGAPTYGVGAVVVKVLYVLIEPLIDTILIVNGQDISLLKTVIYLTPTGITTLAGRLTNLGISSENEKKLRSSAEKISGVSMSGDGNDEDAKGICWNYGDYLFVLMLLTVDNNTCIERFRNIIVLESKAHYGKDFFDISKSYTCVEGKVSGKFNPVLPLGGISTTGLFEQGRTRMRGY